MSTAALLEVRVSDEADLWVALAEAERLGQAAQFAATDIMRLKTVTAELAQNIIKYAGHGRLRLRLLTEPGQPSACELVATDQGPGIQDISAAMRDSFSTGGTLGLGLPGVRRLVDQFNLSSAPGEGTVVTVTVARR